MNRSSAARTPRRLQGDNDQGAVLVEFALTLPLLMMIMLGMFTGGLAYNQKLAITNGVREGSRFGATLSVAASSCSSGSGTMGCWLQQVADVTQSASEGEVGSSVASRNICVAYVYPPGRPSSDSTTRLVRTAAGDTVTTGSTCFSDGRPNSERRVQVSASRVGNLEFLVATVTPTLSSDSVTKFEAA